MSFARGFFNQSDRPGRVTGYDNGYIEHQICIELRSKSLSVVLGQILMLAVLWLVGSEAFRASGSTQFCASLILVACTARMALPIGEKGECRKAFSVVIALGAIGWSGVLYHLVSLAEDIVQTAVLATLAVGGLVAGAAFTLTVSLRDFLIFEVSILLTAVILMSLSIKEIQIRSAAIFLVGIFFFYLVYQRQKSFNSWKVLIEKSKMAALGEMAANLAHEVNNPLSILSGRVSKLDRLVRQGQFEQNEYVRLLEIVEKSGARISKIISGIQAFARYAEQDPFVLEKVGTIVEDTLSFCEGRFGNRVVALRVKEIPADLALECRGSQISQVLLNLLNNSYDAVENASEKWVEIEVVDLGKRVHIMVTDSGPEIPEEYRDRLLESFFTTKEVGKGAGLGLSISRTIVESHHGNLYFDFSYPHTRVIIDLPKIQKSQS